MLPIERASDLPDIEEIPWAIRPYVAYGAITEIVGRAKAAGKSTLVWYLVKAYINGDKFLGQKTSQGKVLYLTEEPLTTLHPTLQKLDLLHKDLYLLRWSTVWDQSWKKLSSQLHNTLNTIDAKFLVVDTFPQFAPDSEQDSLSGLTALRPLQLVASYGVAVIIVRHERKAGGSVGQAGRGTTAIGGGVDVMCHLRRKGAKETGVRILTALSRFSATPAEQIIQLEAKGYSIVKRTKKGELLDEIV